MVSVSFMEILWQFSERLYDLWTEIGEIPWLYVN